MWFGMRSILMMVFSHRQNGKFGTQKDQIENVRTKNNSIRNEFWLNYSTNKFAIKSIANWFNVLKCRTSEWKLERLFGFFSLDVNFFILLVKYNFTLIHDTFTSFSTNFLQKKKKNRNLSIRPSVHSNLRWYSFTINPSIFFKKS